MRRVDISRRPTGAALADVVTFVESIAVARGARPISDHLWLDLTRTDEGGDVDAGPIVVTVADVERILGMAQISRANDGAVLELVTADDVSDAEQIVADLVDTAIDTHVRLGGGRLTWWVDGAASELDAIAAIHGLAVTRELYEMRRSLPHPDRSSVTTRDFDDADIDGWLAVNNAAFATHGEQGGWTPATFASRRAEAWFDPSGFRIHEIDGRIAAFCWTKVHDETDPVLGEIYVIAVDPAFHGRGLGRQLTLAGLDSLADRGIGLAQLYVDAGNVAAVRLYESLGFVVHHTRRALAGTPGDPLAH